MKKNVCPHCKADLVKEGVKFSQAGEQTYKLTLSGGSNNKPFELEYEMDEFYNDDPGEYYCGSCSHTLENFGEEEAIEILKLAKKGE